MECIVRFLLFLLSLYTILQADFSVASYNVENLFDAKNQGTEYDDYKAGAHNWNEHMAVQNKEKNKG